MPPCAPKAVTERAAAAWPTRTASSSESPSASPAANPALKGVAGGGGVHHLHAEAGDVDHLRPARGHIGPVAAGFVDDAAHAQIQQVFDPRGALSASSPSAGVMARSSDSLGVM